MGTINMDETDLMFLCSATMGSKILGRRMSLTISHGSLFPSGVSTSVGSNT